MVALILLQSGMVMMDEANQALAKALILLGVTYMAVSCCVAKKHGMHPTRQAIRTACCIACCIAEKSMQIVGRMGAERCS